MTIIVELAKVFEWLGVAGCVFVPTVIIIVLALYLTGLNSEKY